MGKRFRCQWVAREGVGLRQSFHKAPAGLPEARWSEIIFDVWPVRPFLSNSIQFVPVPPPRAVHGRLSQEAQKHPITLVTHECMGRERHIFSESL